MNPVVSQLQSKFPLSPKKFWKKFLEKNIIGIFLAPIFILGFVMCLVFIEQVDSIVFGIFGAILGLLVLGMVLSVWYIKVYIRTYFYEGEQNYLTIRKGVFTSTEIHVPYNKIQDVYVDQDFWDRYIFGLYDVHIASATASSGMEAHIDGVEKDQADGLKHYLLERLHGGSMAQGATLVENVSGQTSRVAQQVTNATGRMTITLDKKVSNEQYPIIGAWWVGAISKAIGGSIITVIAVLYVFSGTENEFDNIGATIYIGILMISLIWSLIKLFLFKKNYRFDFTPQYLYLRNGIFSMSETHMPYSSIQDVRVEQSFIDRVFGVYTVAIENAVGGGGQVKNFFSKPGEVKDNAIKLLGLSKQSADEISDMLKVNVLGMHDQTRI